MKKIITIVSLFIAGSAFADGLTITTENYPPYNYSTDNGKTIVGSSTDVVQEIFKRAKVNYKTTMYPWVRAIEMAKTDKDTCVYSTTRTEEREKSFQWVGPIAYNNWVLFAKADSKIVLSSADDVKKYKLGGYRGDAITQYLEGEKFKVDEAVNDDQNVQKLDAGRIDLWASGSAGGPFIANKLNVKIKPVLTLKKAELYLACSLSTSPATIEKLNTAFQGMIKEGFMDKNSK